MSTFKLDPDARPDLADFLRELKNAEARFLVVGAYAVMSHTQKARATKDLDLFVDGTDDNLRLVAKAMGRFGAPTHLCSVEALRPRPDAKFSGVFFGLAPDRIDILSKMALAFDELELRLVEFDMAGQPIPVASQSDLMALKRLALEDDPTRKNDRADLKALEALRTRSR